MVTVRWGRVFGLLFSLVLLILILRNGPALIGLFESAFLAGPGASSLSPLQTTAVLGLVCLLIVAVVRLLTTPGR